MKPPGDAHVLPPRPLLLVVDDQPANIQILYELFKGEYEVCMATNGADAISFCEERQPDLILLDVIMPGMGGYEVCRALKANPATHAIPVIFVTGQNDPSEEARGLEDGGVDFITKPFHAKVVMARVRTHLLLKSQSDRLRENERELRRRHAELEGINDASPLGLFRADCQGICTYVNRTFEIMSGLAAGNALGAGWRQAIHPDDEARVAAHWFDATAHGQHYDDTFRFRHANGDIVHVQVQGAPVMVDGVLTGYVGTVDDVTARRAAEDAVASSEKRLRLITENVPAAIGYVDANERYQFCNRHYDTIFGRRPEDMVGRTVREVYGAVGYLQMSDRIHAALRGERMSFQRSANVRRTPVHLQCEYVPDIGEAGTVLGFYAMVTDVTARRAAEERQADSERLLRTIADNLPVLITYIDREHCFRFANATLRKWTGIEPEQVAGKPFGEVLGGPIYDQRRELIDRALAGERCEFEMVTDTVDPPRYLRSTYIPDVGADGKVKGICTLSTDISSLKVTELELRRLVRFDSLTGLPNRAYLYELLDAAIARGTRGGSALAVLFLDIDHFKAINDSCGHASGDLVLQEFATRLVEGGRTTDTVARLAGDEFVILLEGLKSSDEAELVAAKILARVNQPWLIRDKKMVVTTSIGIAYDQTCQLAGSALIDHADEALYRAKAAGRSRFSTKLC